VVAGGDRLRHLLVAFDHQQAHRELSVPRPGFNAVSLSAGHETVPKPSLAYKQLRTQPERREGDDMNAKANHLSVRHLGPGGRRRRAGPAAAALLASVLLVAACGGGSTGPGVSSHVLTYSMFARWCVR
jgi:hypothetical protein